ncbi:MAG TPA: class I SAM-dependent methyltransferase [Acidobacteriota bacterium]|nr:class I SAM-dependent methyltransferase [Acidobacteriota bacterium]
MTETSTRNAQKKFEFTSVQARPFLANLSTRIDSYEEGVAGFFRWMTGLDYYYAVDQVVNLVVGTGKIRVIDLLADTATFALRLAGRKAFHGRIFSFDSNITLLERARQRAMHLNLQDCIEFRHLQQTGFPLSDDFGDLAVSLFDLHRHPAEQYLSEIKRILARDGHLILAELLEPGSSRNSARRLWRRMHLRFIQKNSVEARAVYHDRDELIKLLFKIGFRQVIAQDLNSPASKNSGVFSLITAIK